MLAAAPSEIDFSPSWGYFSRDNYVIVHDHVDRCRLLRRAVDHVQRMIHVVPIMPKRPLKTPNGTRSGHVSVRAAAFGEMGFYDNNRL